MANSIRDRVALSLIEMEVGEMYVIWGENAKLYSFGPSHPFNASRYTLFEDAFEKVREELKIDILQPSLASFSEITLFHTPSYVELVKERSQEGRGYLDYGDTPAFKGVYEASSYLVGSAISAAKLALSGIPAFQVAGGLHHARRDRAGGFCVFNDPGVAISYILEEEGIGRLLYIDIDAHHGDGVMYGFYDDERVIILDIHEDGRYLYPGTGFEDEKGKGKAYGTKFNIPLPPGAGDDELVRGIKLAEDIVNRFSPHVLLVQAGVDGLSSDPLTHLSYTIDGYREVIDFLRYLSKKYFEDKIILFGGGGYKAKNLKDAWIHIIKAFTKE